MGAQTLSVSGSLGLFVLESRRADLEAKQKEDQVSKRNQGLGFRVPKP